MTRRLAAAATSLCEKNMEPPFVRPINPCPLGVVRDNWLCWNQSGKEYRLFYDDFLKMNVQHRTSNIERRMKKILKNLTTPINRDLRQDMSTSSSRVTTVKALAVAVQYRCLFLHVSNSTFDVGRSMFDVHSFRPGFFALPDSRQLS